VTPRPDATTAQEESAKGEHGETKEAEEAASKDAVVDAESKPAPAAELPADVRARLRRLDKIDSKYHGMGTLRNIQSEGKC
jgi:hypothetical protein